MEPQSVEDNAFGPETDLILSLLVMVLLVGVLAWYQGRGVVEETKRKNQELIFTDTAGRFRQGKDVLDEDTRQKLQKLAPAMKDDIVKGKFKYFEIAGAASPDISKRSLDGGGIDKNLRLGYDRAAKVAQYLHESQGMPYECMKVSSYGRAASTFLVEYFQEHASTSPAELLRHFEGNPALVKANESRFAIDRKTDVLGIPPLRERTGKLETSACRLLLSRGTGR